MVDQNPMVNHPAVIRLLYVQAWNGVRDLYAAQPLSKIRGFQAKHFSFNVDGGRCEPAKAKAKK